MSDATESVIGAERPKPAAARSTGVVVLSTVAVIAAGVAIAVQTSINGHVSALTGSPVLATAINNAAALVVGVLVAAVTGAFPRAWHSLRARRGELRRWWFLGGLMGLTAVIAANVVSPLVGVVTVAVGIMLGQLAGSTVADAGGIGPGGRRALSPFRIVGIGVSILAVLVGAWGRIDGSSWWAIAILVVAGFIVSFQQAANGWLLVVTGGEWAVMTVINFVVAGVGIAVVFAIVNPIRPADFSAVPWWAPFGGLAGIGVGVVLAITARTIGMLGSVLCIAAGQAIGSIAVDLVVPVDRVGVTATSIAGAILSVLAVGVAGLGSAHRRGRAAAGSRD